MSSFFSSVFFIRVLICSTLSSSKEPLENNEERKISSQFKVIQKNPI